MHINLPIKETDTPDFWIKRGIAIISQLSDWITIFYDYILKFYK